MISKLFKFKGGVHIPQHKESSTQLAVEPASIPKRLILPLTQHIGTPAAPIVEVGQKVLKGEKIAQADGYVSAPVHAPTSGIIEDIGDYPLPHPSGMLAQCIVIKPDGEDRWIELKGHSGDYKQLDPSELRNIIRSSGIVGLGGAGFPTSIKHNPGPDRVIDTLILNGAECEPYITCDDMLMREKSREIICGLLITKHALQAKRCIIAIENNKTLAIESMQQAAKEFADRNIEVVAIPTVYPAGSEKQIIYTITGKETPKNGLPLHIGVVCQNVGTTAAVYRAIHHGEPLISRYVTIAGDVKQPRNLEVLFGTSANDLIEQCGGSTADIRRIIIGGPMMGFAMQQITIPVIKTTNCILIDAGQTKDLHTRQYTMPCIRCDSCADVCPVNLLPQQLYWFSKAQELDRIQEYNVFDCIECGCCDYVCPSQIPLVQYYRFAKSEIWKRERETQKSDAARDRHEFHQFRIDREKAEKAEKLRQKKAALKIKKQATDQSNEIGNNDKKEAEPKNAAIVAAMERVKAKKAQQKVEPKNTDDLTDHQKKLVTEIDQRRAEQRETQVSNSNDNAKMDNKEL
ncbi:MAG: electron transport complex subunit RsxC [Gammaproteobacteria bacterium]|nr:electron transport complex subunit RsxC [Gammaproteobacteria bacterium]